MKCIRWTLLVVSAALVLVACNNQDKDLQNNPSSASNGASGRAGVVRNTSASESISASNTADSGADATAGEAFLAKNKTAPGVKTTASGLQYKMDKVGTGKRPKSTTDVVLVSYEGRLLDGTVFDSSDKRDSRSKFQLNHVIPGWTEGLMLMREGGEATFYVPAKLAYGKQGIKGVVPPNSTLIFKIKLIMVGLDKDPLVEWWTTDMPARKQASD